MVKKNKSPFCQTKKKEKLNACAFTDEKNKILGESERGSYFGQEKQWPDVFLDEKSNETGNASRSKAKITDSLESLKKRKAQESESLPMNRIHRRWATTNLMAMASKQLWDVTLSILNVCKNCLTIQQFVRIATAQLRIVEKANSRYGLGAKWVFRCTKQTCISQKIRNAVPISEYSGQKYAVNVSSVVAFQSIGKGRAAAEKCLSILFLFFDIFIILWTQNVNRKGKQRFVLFSDHLVFLLLYFVAISVLLSKTN